LAGRLTEQERAARILALLALAGEALVEGQQEDEPRE
jgi:hypothetical protein